MHKHAVLALSTVGVFVSLLILPLFPSLPFANALAQDQRGKIVFYRESHFGDKEFIPPLFCDGMQLGRMVDGTYLEVSAPAGPHVCSAESNWQMSIDVFPNSVVYVRVSVNVAFGFKSHAYLAIVTEADYKRQKKLTALAAPVRLADAEPAAIPPPQSVPSASSTEAANKHSGQFGDLTVTASAVETRTAFSSPGRSIVTVHAIATNAGSGAICASFAAKLETTSDLEYMRAFPKASDIQELSPGEKWLSSYEFDVKEGVQPLELVLELQGHTTTCGNSASAPPLDVAIPDQVRLDLRDLPESPATARQLSGRASYPTCIYCPEPAITARARSAGFEGTVVLQTVIGTDGRATDIQITRSSGYADLDKSAIDAVQKWRFKPALNPQGAPVPTSTPIEITYRLKN